MYRKVAVLFLVTVALGCTSGGRTLVHTPAQAIAAVEEAEDKRWAAAASGDIATARQLIAPEFVFVHTTGAVHDLKQFEEFTTRLGRSSAERPQLLSPPTYRVVHNLVIRTQLTASPPRPNLPNANFRSLDIFTYRDGSWLWLAHQGTMVQPPWRTVTLELALLAEYTGTYTNEQGETRSYESRGSRLVQLPNRSSAADVALLAISENTFAVEGSSTTHTFLRDRAGRVSDVQIMGPLGLSRLRRQ